MDGDLFAGRYRLEERLGRGGTADVWLADDTELERPVALKLLGFDADRARFAREARAAASLDHPNLIRIYDYGEWEERPFMVLELLPGGSLEDRLVEAKPLDDATTSALAAELAAGLAHAHARGLVHRDLKPANVLFDAEGRAKIADFGIARLGGAGTLTEAGTVLGTAAYISPEQAGGEQATPASDVYSLGVILFRLLTGRLPFEAGAALELAALHRSAAPPRLVDVRPDVPPRLEALVTAALAKDPADRPSDGAAVLRELADGAATTVETRVILPPAVPAPSHARARRRRRLVPLAIAALLLAAAGIAAAFLLAANRTDERATTAARPSPRPSTTHAVIAATSAPEPPPVTTATPTSSPATTRRQTTAAATTAPPPPPPPATDTEPPPDTTPTTEATSPTVTGGGVTVTLPPVP